jgi:chorismate mutase / prephenate dehydratase
MNQNNPSTAQTSIDTVRGEINKVDGKILELLAQRRSFAKEIVTLKNETGAALRDQKREEELLIDRIRNGKTFGLDSHLVTRIFHEIIEDSNRLQRELLQTNINGSQSGTLERVAFHGIEGSYSYFAAHKYFARSVNDTAYVSCATYEEVISSVEKGKAEFAIVPIENTASGAMTEVYDLLLKSPVSIVGEEKFLLNHCLIASAQTNLSSIKVIYCSPQTVSQCSNFIATLPQARVEYFSDSALSLKHLKQGGESNVAAIASEEAARQFGLEVIKRDITNQADTYNRYLILSRQPQKVDPRIPSKTSLVMSTPQTAGALVNALLVFQQNNINLAKLESRPIAGNPWEEMFYIDFEGNISDDRVKAALEALVPHTKFMKVIGCYPSYDLPPVQAYPTDTTNNLEGSSDKPAAAVATESKPKKKSTLLASRDRKSEDTIIEVKGVKIGGSSFIVMAGPCSVESEEQILSCAREAKENGALILRGGCFKPRTSPYSFQGLGLKGLDLLSEAGRAFGLPIITEVMSPEDVTDVAEKSDILQIGARNMQNFSLLKMVGRTQRPILLKRGMSASLDELLQATEYILAEGNQQVILCERGIRTFETATRNTLDLSAVPVLKRMTHLPIIVDPSHAAGERDLVPPLALASKAVGAHGIIVEFHPEPEKALSDGPQALRYPQFEKLMVDLRGLS